MYTVRTKTEVIDGFQYIENAYDCLKQHFGAYIQYSKLDVFLFNRDNAKRLKAMLERAKRTYALDEERKNLKRYRIISSSKYEAIRKVRFGD